MSLLHHLLRPVQLPGLLKKNFRAWVARAFLRVHGVEFGADVKLFGRPEIVRLCGRIRLGDGVVLLSKGRRYHTAIYHPTRLMTDSSVTATIEIGDHTRINGASIHATDRITIGKRCLIGANVTILDGDGHGVALADREQTNPVSRPVVIEDRVWIGINSIILKGVHIGAGAVVGAGSVVARDVPPETLVAGNPAQVVRSLTEARSDPAVLEECAG
jgi:acetyltransferase-like isoleucine patch superfamily enzyme